MRGIGMGPGRRKDFEVVSTWKGVELDNVVYISLLLGERCYGTSVIERISYIIESESTQKRTRRPPKEKPSLFLLLDSPTPPPPHPLPFPIALTIHPRPQPTIREPHIRTAHPEQRRRTLKHEIVLLIVRLGFFSQGDVFEPGLWEVVL